MFVPCRGIFATSIGTHRDADCIRRQRGMAFLPLPFSTSLAGNVENPAKETPMPLLQNHIAVITGAGSGIGRAIASGYAREGAQVVLLDVNADTVAEAAVEIRNSGGKAESFALDLTKRDDCFALSPQASH